MLNNEKYSGSVADSLTPTFENVVREFTTKTMKDILLNAKKISFNFVFMEAEAINHIEEVFEKYIAEYSSGFKNDADRIIQILKQGNNMENALPSLIINDYKLFFELLRQYYEKVIELFFKRTKASGFMVYEKENCFEHIWLRTTPEDFNNPEQFLKKQVEFISDNTFANFDNEAILGQLSMIDNHVLAVKNEIARTWDETPLEFKVMIYDKNHYKNTNLFDRPHHTLPVIRYGIYEKNGKKICVIGSVQSKKDSSSEQIKKLFNRLRYKVNTGISINENSCEVEPSHIIALSTFIIFLRNEGITEIEAPSMYILDYQYHQKRNITLVDEFQSNWTEYKQQEDPEGYLEEKQRLESMLNKENLISKNKTERFINTFMSIMYRYPNYEIESYAGELDSSLHINIPSVSSLIDSNNGVLQEINALVDNAYRWGFIYGRGEVVAEKEANLVSLNSEEVVVVWNYKFGRIFQLNGQPIGQIKIEENQNGFAMSFAKNDQDQFELIKDQDYIQISSGKFKKYQNGEYEYKPYMKSDDDFFDIPSESNSRRIG